MNQRPLLSSIDLWDDHEQLCKRLLRDALVELANSPVDADENSLNRLLYGAIIRVSHRASQSGDHIPPVVPEGKNPPAASDQERAEREFKIPDFYWSFIDPLASDPNDASKQFVVECKRLTNPTARYAREYVRSGIARFISFGHGYGKGMRSGAMVGYVQGIPFEEALERVKGEINRDSIQALATIRRHGEIDAEFGHQVTRPFPVSPFHITHVWTRIGPEPDP